MTDAQRTPGTTKGRRWLRRLVWTGAGLVGLLVALYFVVTSAAFLKGVILPRAGQVFNATITVEDAAISPFSQIVLRDFKLQAAGAEPLVAAKEVRARYRLMDILRGNLNVDEVSVNSPAVVVRQNADGTSNLDPILKALGEEAPTQPASGPTEPLQMNLKRLAIQNGSVVWSQQNPDGSRMAAELQNLSVTADGVQNGRTASLAIGSSLKFVSATQTNSDEIAATLKGAFQAELDESLMAKTVNGSAELSVGSATGALAVAAQLGAKLTADMTPSDIKQLALQFTQANNALGAISASGPFDLLKQEGHLKVEVAGIDKQVLNLAGAPLGIDFGPTTINSSNQIDVAKGATQITVNGQLVMGRFSVTQQGQTTPPLDLTAGYHVTADPSQSNAVLQAFTLRGEQNGSALLHGALSKPMKIDWGKAEGAVDESAFDLTVTNLNLADWRAFAADVDPKGRLNLNLHLLSQQAGRKLKLDLITQLDDFAAVQGSNGIDQADLAMTLQAEVQDFERVNLGLLDVRVAHQKQPAAQFSGSGQIDSKTQDTELQTKLQVMLPRIAALLGNPDLKVRAGDLEFTGRIAQKNLTPSQTNHPAFDRTIAGKLRLNQFTGQYAAYGFDQLETAGDLDVAVKNNLAEIRQLSATVRQKGQPGGTVQMSGSFDLVKTNGSVALKVTDLNQNLLSSFAAPALGSNQLRSISISATATARVDPAGESALKGDMKVANLVVSDPAGTLPKTPLEVGLQLDAAMANQVVDLRQCQLALSPTARATNQLQLAGRVDLSYSNAVTGHLKFTADSLDLTPYYDRFAVEQKPSAAAPAQPAPAVPPASPSAEQEPPPFILPVKQFGLDASVGRLYLREVAISNVVAALKLDGGRIDLKPLQLVLNGAPVNGHTLVNLAVPGYEYDVAATADKVPLAPLVNSFQPDRKGQVAGTLDALVQVKGAGMTGASLQKNLSGQFDIATTNLNLSLLTVRNPLLKSVIDVIVGIPDLIRDPSTAVTTLISRLRSGGSQGGGWVDQVTQAPIDVITLQSRAGNGRVELQQALVQSAAFLAGTTNGTVTLAAVLTNSPIDLPIMISLERSLAEKAKLAPAGTPANVTYVGLPKFLTMKGTLGEPQKQINYLALASVAAKAGQGLIGNTGNASLDKASDVLGTVGNLLAGRAPGTTQTNQATNATPAKPLPINPFDLLKKVLPPQKTNQ